VPTYIVEYSPLLLALLPLAAWIIGCGAKRSDVKRGDHTFHLFFATRPVGDASLVGRKLVAAARSSAVSWAVVLIGLAILASRTKGGYQNVAGDFVAPQKLPVLAVLAPYLDVRLFLRLGAILALLVLWTWRNYAVGFWTELRGRLWLRYAYPIGSLTAATAFLTYFNETHVPGHGADGLPIIVAAIWALVGLKAAIAAVLVRIQLKTGLLTTRSLIRGAVLYASGCALAVSLVLWLTNDYRNELLDQRVSSRWVLDGGVAALVLFWIPVVRLLAAPMMLKMNRHRT